MSSQQSDKDEVPTLLTKVLTTLWTSPNECKLSQVLRSWCCLCFPSADLQHRPLYSSPLLMFPSFRICRGDTEETLREVHLKFQGAWNQGESQDTQGVKEIHLLVVSNI